MSKCDCHSYNADTGSTPEVAMQHETGGTAYIDACIAPVIRHLWDNGVWTIGSCCGHGGQFGSPSIVLGENVDNYREVRRLIAKVDKRHFELTQWKRVIV